MIKVNEVIRELNKEDFKPYLKVTMLVDLEKSIDERILLGSIDEYYKSIGKLIVDQINQLNS